MNYFLILIITIQVTAPCNISLLNDYTYTLLQRDYCQQLLNSSKINVTLDDIDDSTPNTLIPINANVQSLILNSTWSISVQASNRFGNDSTTYTNITDTGNDINNCQSFIIFTDIIQSCNSVLSSSITHLSSSDMLLTSTSMHSSTSLSVPLPPLPYMYVMLSFFFWQLLIHLPPPLPLPFPPPVLPQDHQLIQVYGCYLTIVYIYLLHYR